MIGAVAASIGRFLLGASEGIAVQAIMLLGRDALTKIDWHRFVHQDRPLGKSRAYSARRRRLPVVSESGTKAL